MTETLTIKLTKEEMQKLDRTWKRHDLCMNRSQYVRLAINTLAGEEILKIKLAQLEAKENEN